MHRTNYDFLMDCGGLGAATYSYSGKDFLGLFQNVDVRRLAQSSGLARRIQLGFAQSAALGGCFTSRGSDPL